MQHLFDIYKQYIYNINQLKGGNIMYSNKRDYFYITDLCLITNIKEINENNNKYTKYIYNKVEKKIVYYKNQKYIDIETNEKYSTNYNNIGDKFINVGNIIPFTTYLKNKRVKYNINDIKNKKKVKELYKKINE